MSNDDSFILKLDANGNFVWVVQFGGTNYDYGKHITIDNSGYLYSIGEFTNIADFDPSNAVFNLTSAGNKDIYIQKIDTNGNFLWAKRMGGPSYDIGAALTLDQAGNIYTTGSFAGTADLDPGSGIQNVTSLGSFDSFAQKLDSNGNLIWVKRIGGMNDDYSTSINVDAQGNVVTSGYFEGSIDFDPGAGVFNMTAGFRTDGFIQMLNHTGNFVWAKSMGSPSDGDRIYASVLDHHGNLYSTGFFNDTVDFNPSSGIDRIAATRYSDIFIQKFSPCVPINTVDTVIACDSFTWINGINYTTSNQSAVHTMESSFGCDSTVSLHLTVNYSSPSTVDTIVACDSITWVDGNLYTSSNNTATYIYTNEQGCDSIVRLDLTINANSGVDRISACDSIVWIDGNTYYNSTNNVVNYRLTNTNGCDSIVTLDLTIHNNYSIDSIRSCNPIVWIDGNTYSS